MATTRGDTTSLKSTFADVLERETATTLKVLGAFPKDQSELRPHPRAKNARELVWLFAMELKLASLALSDKLDTSKRFPPPPDSFDDVIAAFESGRRELLDQLETAPPDGFEGTVHFFTGPKQMGDIPKTDFLWFLLHDHIHHRGQFSVYLRMAGGKVPSIYGPSADEPWS
ncbi:MAG: DinB family protein [Longimicrobiales bacterium]